MTTRHRYQPLTHEQHVRIELGIYATRSGDTLTIDIAANLNGLNAGMLRRAVVEALADGVMSVRLELARCEGVDRRGLETLVQFYHAARLKHATLVLAGANPSVRASLAHLGLAKLLSDEPEAHCAERRAEET